MVALSHQSYSLARLDRSWLTRTKREGGLALPDIRRYFWAAILNRVSDWKYHKNSKLWVSLEIDLCGSDLYTLLWIPKKYRSLAASTSPLTRSTLMAWDFLCTTHNWSYNSPLMPLTGHNFFPPGNMDPKNHSWNLRHTVLLHQVTTTSGMVPLSSLESTPTVSLMTQWRYHQLLTFVKSLPKPIRDINNLTPIETAFMDEQPVEKPLSYFYHVLQSLASFGYPSYISNWEKDLHKDLTETQKSTILILSDTSSISSKLIEVNYKLLTRWHYTPEVLHRTFLETSPFCWRCCGERASHAHVWWYCPIIRPYWLTILYWIKEIQGSEVSNDPWMVLLHCTDKPIGSYKRSITPHLLNAAKALIPRYWKKPMAPTLCQWLMAVDQIYYMEDLTYSLRNKTELIKNIWSCWVAFKYMSAYAELMASNV